MDSSDQASKLLSLAQNQGQEYLISGVDLGQWIHAARSAAIAADVPMTELDWLLQEVTELDRLALRLGSFQNRNSIALKLPLTELEQLWQQRLQARVPVQYLTGIAPWRNFTLSVSPAVLIPRPETECLIDIVQAAVHAQSENGIDLQTGDWADLGTGSGAIALGLAEILPNAAIHAVDFSPHALAVAQYNAQQVGMADRIQFYSGSWFEPLDYLKGQLKGLVSNPPYIPSPLVPELQPEVAWHEPHSALDGGPDGLADIRHLIAIAPEYLQPGGIWLIEMMAGQAEVVAELLHQQGSYAQIQIHSDLAGIPRFALGFRQ